MARHRYEPQQQGWITIWDPWNDLMGAIDCRGGGAQRVFAQLAADFECGGWELQGRSFDSQFMRRGSIRWYVLITQRDPFERDTSPGFMALLVKDKKG